MKHIDEPQMPLYLDPITEYAEFWLHPAWAESRDLLALRWGRALRVQIGLAWLEERISTDRASKRTVMVAERLLPFAIPGKDLPRGVSEVTFEFLLFTAGLDVWDRLPDARTARLTLEYFTTETTLAHLAQSAAPESALTRARTGQIVDDAVGILHEALEAVCPGSAAVYQRQQLRKRWSGRPPTQQAQPRRSKSEAARARWSDPL